MSTTIYKANATLTVDKDVVSCLSNLLIGICDYLGDHTEELDEGHLQNYNELSYWELYDLFQQYLSMDADGVVHIHHDTEDDRAYDTGVFDFLCNHLCLLQSSEYMVVNWHLHDSREGESMGVNYYDQSGAPVTPEDIARNKLLNVREQLQEDIRTFCDGMDQEVIDKLCQIVVDNFKKL